MTTTLSIVLKDVVFFNHMILLHFYYFLQCIFLLSGSAGCETHRWVQEGKTDDDAQQTFQDCMEAVGLDPTRLLPAEEFTPSC